MCSKTPTLADNARNAKQECLYYTFWNLFEPDAAVIIIGNFWKVGFINKQGDKMNEEYSRMAAGAIEHASLMVQHSIQQAIIGYGEPSAIYKPRVFPDGDKWCALYGDNIQDGVCGFGDTPAAAVIDFNNCWNGFGRYAKKSNT